MITSTSALVWMHFWGTVIFFTWLQDQRKDEATNITRVMDFIFSSFWPVSDPVLVLGVSIYRLMEK